MQIPLRTSLADWALLGKLVDETQREVSKNRSAFVAIVSKLLF